MYIQNNNDKSIQILKGISEEIEDEWIKLIPNKKFNKYDSKAKQNYYKERLKHRLFKRKDYMFRIFNTATEIIDDVIPKEIENQFKYFTNVELFKEGVRNDISFKIPTYDLVNRTIKPIGIDPVYNPLNYPPHYFDDLYTVNAEPMAYLIEKHRQYGEAYHDCFQYGTTLTYTGAPLVERKNKNDKL